MALVGYVGEPMKVRYAKTKLIDSGQSGLDSYIDERAHRRLALADISGTVSWLAHDWSPNGLRSILAAMVKG